MSSVSGAGGISPDDMKAYRQQFEQSVSIFEKSLNGYSQSKEANQKAEFKKAMDESLQVMNQLGPVFAKEIQKQKEQLQADYTQYTSQESTKNLGQVQNDLSQLKRRL